VGGLYVFLRRCRRAVRLGCESRPVLMRVSVAGGRLRRAGLLYLRGDVGGDWVDSEYVLVLLPAYPCVMGENKPAVVWVCVSLGGDTCNVAITRGRGVYQSFVICSLAG